jgi:hypothetical protein
MAEKSKSGKYIKVEVNVWYDPKADNIHITSGDKDFGPNGLHMTAKKGTQSDRNARTALEKHGFIASKQADKVKDLAELIGSAQLDAAGKDMLKKAIDDLS